MAEIRKFDFNKSYEEVEIAGNKYQIDFSDEKVKEYAVVTQDFFDKSKELHAIDTKNMPVDEQLELFNEMDGIVKEFIEMILGQDTYDELYKQSGNSLMNMIELVNFIADLIGEKSTKAKNSRKQNYVKQKHPSQIRNQNRAANKKARK